MTTAPTLAMTPKPKPSSKPPELVAITDALCTSMCGEVSLHLRKDGKISILTPFRFPDGDALLMIAEPTSTGGIRLSDFGDTLMRLSYSMDVDDLIKPGNRNDLFNKILIDYGVGFEHGAIYIETVVTEIGRAVFSLSQAMSQIFDISFLSRTRVLSTFYEDL